MFLKKWIVEKNELPSNDMRRYEIERETEKAIYVSYKVIIKVEKLTLKNGETFKEYLGNGIYSKERTEYTWLPKSAIVEEDYRLEEIAKVEKAFSNYDQVLTFCKENKIAGVRNKMKLTSLTKKIKNAGLYEIALEKGLKLRFN